jgi:hypothetical protein
MRSRTDRTGRKGSTRGLTLAGLLAALAAVLAVTGSSAAGTAKKRPLTAVALPAVQPGVFHGDVRSLKPVPVKQRGDFEVHLRKPTRTAPTGPVVAGEATPLAPSMPAATTFPGLAFAGTCGEELCGAGWPPDPVGDVGPNHYVEAVNTAVGIYSKTGTQLAAFTFNALWSGAGTGTPCDTSNFGDVTVVYDQLADRWIVADLGFELDASLTTPVPPFYECIAVSRTGDPVGGGWYLYPVRMDPGTPGAPPNGYLNDYPKLGLWPDALYLTANEFDLTVPTQPFKGVALWAFDRVAMEAGQPLRQLVVFTADPNDPVSVLPGNLRGPPPPTGTPEYLVSESPTSYAFEVRTYTVNWSGTPSGVVSAPTAVSQAPYVVAAGDIVPQPNDPFGASGNLDMIDDRPMMQAQYRNLGGVESLWVAHTVRTTTSSPTALQWAQLDVTGRTIASSPVQQQIFTNGGDGVWRFMPSLAVDAAGNMAIGYSASGSALYPSIRYSGRLAGDPPNTLGQAEAVLQAGLGSQTVSPRWGDYSSMTVDPTDDCTFWYVNEYYATPYDGSLFFAQWSTRIGSFRFPGCMAGPATGTLQGTVTDASPGGALAGATVSLSSGPSATSDATGAYRFASLVPGTYDVTASRAGYATASATGVAVAAGATTTRDFSLTPQPTTGALEGTITDASTGGVIAGATVTLSTGPSTTSDTAGRYRFASLAPGSYGITVSKAGYTTSTVTGIAVAAGATTTRDVALGAPAPTLTSFSPKQGRVGSSVTINGTNLLTARSVAFNGTAASFTVVSATRITANVPAGAGTGRIRVTTSGGTATSSQSFKVR